MNAMGLAAKIVKYVHDESVSFDADDYGVPGFTIRHPGSDYRSKRDEIEEGVAKLLSPSPTPTFDTARRAGVMLVAAGVLTQRQWDAAVAFVEAIGEGAK